MASRYNNVSEAVLPGTSRPLIGREADLHQLLTTAHVTLAQQSLHSLLIIGQPGIGKSQLLYSFLSQMHNLPETFTILRSTASPTTHTAPYDLLVQALAPCFHLTPHDTQTTAIVKIAHTVDIIHLPP